MTTVQILIVVALLGIWAWVLGRPLISSMFNRAQRDPVGHFNRHMAVLGDAPRRSAGAGRMAPRASLGGGWTSQPARKRRVQLMMALALSTAVAGLLAVAFQGIFVNQFLLLGVLLLSYVGLAAVMGGRQAERGEKVAYLGQQPQRGRSSHQGRPGQRVRAVGER